MSTDLGGLGGGEDLRSFGDQLVTDAEASPETQETAEEPSASTEAGADAEATTSDVQEPTEGSETEEAQAAQEEESPEAETEETEDAVSDDDVFEVTVNGETTEMTLEELAKGYLRESDYTQKTQVLAAERKEVEAERERMASEMQPRMQRLEQLTQELEGHIQASQRSPEEWEALREQDFPEFDRQRGLEQRRREAVVLARQEAQRQAHEQLVASIPQERTSLVKALVSDGFQDWSNPDGFHREYQKLGQFVTTQMGITPEEWDQVVDHRSIRIAYLAMQHMEAAKSAPALKDKIRRKPKPALRAGAPRQPEDVSAKRSKEAMARLKKTNRIEDAANAILS